MVKKIFNFRKRKKLIILFGVALLLGGGIRLAAEQINQRWTQVQEGPCGGSNRYNRDCWWPAIRYAMQAKGLDEAFNVLADIYDKEPEFAASCHDITHQLGREAYRLFIAHKPFHVTPKAGYCSYGFYHGFMEMLAQEENELDRAQEFCGMVDEQLKEESPDASLQCFHGIGHGTVNNHDPATWGNDKVMVGDALDLKLARTASKMRYEIQPSVPV